MSIQDVIRNEQFYHVFQPIFDTVDLRKLGFEALLRGDIEPSPKKLFNEAIQEEQLFELDSGSIQKAVRTYFSESPRNEGYLFINVLPSTIIHRNFPSFLKQIMFDISNYCQIENYSKLIVFEISESEDISIFNLKTFTERIKLIKEAGILIAIDDIGKGFDHLSLLIELEPHFIKLDNYFSKDLFKTKQKQLLLRLLLNYCFENNCNLILEGIEEELDFSVAKSIGVRFGQGYLLGRPGLLKHKLIQN